MIVYDIRDTEGFEFLNAVDDADYDKFLDLDGRPRFETWKPIRVRRVRCEGGELSESDFPWLGSHALVLKENSVTVLRPMLARHGELLPLSTEDGIPLFVHNTTAVDALDESRSQVKRFPSSNRVMDIIKPFFRSDVIRGVDIFRLPLRAMPVYVSDAFVARVAESGLTGLRFREVWRDG